MRLVRWGGGGERDNPPDVQEVTFEGGERFPGSLVLGARLSFVVVLGPQVVFQEIDLKP